MKNKNLLILGGALALIGIGYYVWKTQPPKPQNSGEQPPKPQNSGEQAPKPQNSGEQAPKCAADEYEQSVFCVAAPCPTMCVKKGFTGNKKNYISSSFFNQPKQRSQDTSF